MPVHSFLAVQFFFALQSYLLFSLLFAVQPSFCCSVFFCFSVFLLFSILFTILPSFYYSALYLLFCLLFTILPSFYCSVLFFCFSISFLFSGIFSIRSYYPGTASWSVASRGRVIKQDRRISPVLLLFCGYSPDPAENNAPFVHRCFVGTLSVINHPSGFCVY